MVSITERAVTIYDSLQEEASTGLTSHETADGQKLLRWLADEAAAAGVSFDATKMEDTVNAKQHTTTAQRVSIFLSQALPSPAGK
jgi:hypothetical protein